MATCCRARIRWRWGVSIWRTSLVWPKRALGHGRGIGLPLLLYPDTLENLISDSHGHATKVGHEVHAVSVGCKAAL